MTVDPPARRGRHPVHLANYGACIDHRSGDRRGLHVVTGHRPSEYRMCGIEPIEHGGRCSMTAEFTEKPRTPWATDENVTVGGEYRSMRDAHALPKPVPRRPVPVGAASSPAGLEHAVRKQGA